MRGAAVGFPFNIHFEGWGVGSRVLQAIFSRDARVACVCRRERIKEVKRDQGWIVSPYCYRQMLQRFREIPRRNLRGISSFACWQQIRFTLCQQHGEKCRIYIHVNARGIENSFRRSEDNTCLPLSNIYVILILWAKYEFHKKILERFLSEVQKRTEIYQPAQWKCYIP